MQEIADKTGLSFLYVKKVLVATLKMMREKGLPTTTGQTETALPGDLDNTQLVLNQFAFVDMDASVAGVDILYVTNENPSIGETGGIIKYSLVGGAWVANGFVGSSAEGYLGLSVKVSGSSVAIFATRRGTNSTIARGGDIVALTDNSGYNGALTGTPTVLASINNRLTGQLRKLVQQDKEHELGKRKITNESLSSLPCIYLNDQCEEDLVTITVKETTISIYPNIKDIKKYVAGIKDKEKPTHLQVFTLMLPFNMNGSSNRQPEKHESHLIPVSKKTDLPLLECELTVSSGSRANLYGVAIVFYKEKKGDFVMLGNKSLNGGWIQGLA